MVQKQKMKRPFIRRFKICLAPAPLISSDYKTQGLSSNLYFSQMNEVYPYKNT